MIWGLWFDSLQPFLPCSWQQYVLLSLCTTGKYFTPLQQIWAGLTLRYSPQSLGGGKTTHPCSQRCCPAWFTLLQWKISCGCNVNQNLQTWEGWLSKETSDAWRHFLLADYLRGVRSPSLSLSRHYAVAPGWQLCAALSWVNGDFLKQIPAGPAIYLCIYLIKFLEDLSESIWAHSTNWADAGKCIQKHVIKRRLWW